MQTLRARWIPLVLLILLVGGPIAWYKWPTTASAAEAALTAPVKQGVFKVTVTTTGELKARKFVQVQGPTTAQQVNVYNSKVTSIVPEGTVVKEGEVIAEIDRSPAATRMNDLTANVAKAQADFTAAELDSALNLAQAREDIRNAGYDVEAKKLLKEQAQFEAPTIKRQAEIDYEKSQRALDQAKLALETKTKQGAANMAAVGADLTKQNNQLKALTSIMDQFTIKAPSPGMVIYLRDWQGKKQGVGSQWNAWNPAVAQLPDLSKMESDTYVNEVDVRKLAVGQKVQIILDADPTKKLSGTVTEVANVGEQRPNQDSKVFEVKVEVAQSDTTLRPGMTTGNAIEVASVPSALFIPLEAVTTDSGRAFVYVQSGRSVVRQQIETGQMNDNEIVVLQGLKKDQQVLLTSPQDKASIKTEFLAGVKALPQGKTGDTLNSVTLPAKPAPATKTAPATKAAPAKKG